MGQNPNYGVFKNLLFESLVDAAKNGQGLEAEKWARIKTEEMSVRFLAHFADGDDLTLPVLKGFVSSSEAIGISDPNGVHYFQNPAFAEMFGYTAEELMSAGGPRAIYNDGDTFRQVFDNIMSGRSWCGEIEMKACCGRVFPVSLRADAIKDIKGNIEGLIGIHTDISERREIERQLRRTQVELSVKSQELSETNEALHRIVVQMKEDRKNAEKRIVDNVGDFVLPYVRRMREVVREPELLVFINVIEDNLNEIVAPFMERLVSGKVSLTPRELEVANLVRTGATSRDIAKLLKVSKRAVEFHRDSLRNKLGLKKSKKNLKSHLDSISGSR
ncbi:MAG: PAS domain S-box protein [Deltaproteobacteria bacterium]|nr:PAS domain S-box protein [Deltaproteobacteria bacterium]